MSRRELTSPSAERVTVVDALSDVLRHVAWPVSLLTAVFLMGASGYYVLGAYYLKHWSLLDCFFMTTITLTTVGYGDALGATTFLAGKVYTMGLLLAGMGATLYSVSAITAFIVEGHLKRAFEEKRM